ncbi:hypothetical protein Tco_0995123 [Tanacetum coccineum]
MPKLTSHGGTMAASLRHQWRDTRAYGCILGNKREVGVTFDPISGGVLQDFFVSLPVPLKNTGRYPMGKVPPRTGE